MRRLAVFCIAMVGVLSPAFAVEAPVPLPRPKPPIKAAPAPWRLPLSFREAAGAEFKSDDVTSAPSACRQRLEKIATLKIMPRLIGPGACGGGDMVELEQVLIAGGKRIEIKSSPMLRCEMAEQFSLWVRDDLVTRIARTGATLTQVETYDDYNCRGRNRVSGAKLSEHGKGNAVDIRGMTFADKKVALFTEKTYAKDVRDDLRVSACARFTTVLGPGSDGYHEEHIHLDLAQRRGGYRMCQWNVLEPPPPPPPKPADIAKADTKDEPRQPEARQAEVAKPEVKQDQPEADDDDAEIVMTMNAPIPIADVPLPRPKPSMKRKRARAGGVGFPLNLFR